MSRSTLKLALASVLALAAGGCGSDTGAATTTTRSAAGTVVPSAGPGTASASPSAQATDGDLPVSADFEDEADVGITADNFEAKLAEIEKELADAPAIDDTTALPDDY